MSSLLIVKRFELHMDLALYKIKYYYYYYVCNPDPYNNMIRVPCAKNKLIKLKKQGAQKTKLTMSERREEIACRHCSRNNNATMDKVL